MTRIDFTEITLFFRVRFLLLIDMNAPRRTYTLFYLHSDLITRIYFFIFSTTIPSPLYAAFCKQISYTADKLHGFVIIPLIIYTAAAVALATRVLFYTPVCNNIIYGTVGINKCIFVFTRANRPIPRVRVYFAFYSPRS